MISSAIRVRWACCIGISFRGGGVAAFLLGEDVLNERCSMCAVLRMLVGVILMNAMVFLPSL